MVNIKQTRYFFVIFIQKHRTGNLPNFILHNFTPHDDKIVAFPPLILRAKKFYYT